MISMSARAFLDTNVLVYCYDRREPRKQTRALEIMQGAWRPIDVVLSTQVLQEFYVVVTRKLANPISAEHAEEAVAELAALPVVPCDAALVRTSIALARRYQLSLWDALILEAARTGSCECVLTEDLQDGLQVEGVRVENPFRDLAAP